MPARNIKPWLWLAVALIVLDQISKWIVLGTLRPGETRYVAPFFNWVLIYGNLGAPRLEILGAALATNLARGVELVAFVVAQAGAALTEAALDAHCLAHIARFKRPKRYEFVEALPKNSYGKVLKTELRALLMGA